MDNTCVLTRGRDSDSSSDSEAHARTDGGGGRRAALCISARARGANGGAGIRNRGRGRGPTGDVERGMHAIAGGRRGRCIAVSIMVHICSLLLNASTDGAIYVLR